LAKFNGLLIFYTVFLTLYGVTGPVLPALVGRAGSPLCGKSVAG